MAKKQVSKEDEFGEPSESTVESTTESEDSEEGDEDELKDSEDW